MVLFIGNTLSIHTNCSCFLSIFFALTEHVYSVSEAQRKGFPCWSFNFSFLTKNIVKVKNLSLLFINFSGLQTSTDKPINYKPLKLNLFFNVFQ